MMGGGPSAVAQEPSSRPQEKPSEQTQEPKAKAAARPELPFQIQLLETHMRFEASGDSRKEVHTIVKIINVLGARQFARISFDYNRSFQKIEIPTVRIRHANGGISEVMPSAVTDAPNPAVEQFPAYHDVRVKSVRILGLQEGDTLEYSVLTTTTKHPLAPNFWLEHTFDRSGQVLEEQYELDLPASPADVRINPATPPTAKEASGSRDDPHTVYRWTRSYSEPKEGATPVEQTPTSGTTADISVSTLRWESLALRLTELMLPGSKPDLPMTTPGESTKQPRRPTEVEDRVREKAVSLTPEAKNDLERLQAIYDFVSTKITTVDLPPDATGFKARDAQAVLNSGYATSEDKYILFAALATVVHLRVDAALTGFCDQGATARPGVFKHLVVVASTREGQYWLDPALEVAPFGMISPTPAKCALFLQRGLVALNSTGQEWVDVPADLPFAAFQKVNVNAVITEEGQLKAKVKYVLRGENELVLRIAFHQTPKEKWKDVAGLLAISDGFRGQVTAAEASDPTVTTEPFTVEYELTQLRFVDWSKKPVRIPALLPQISLPDPIAVRGPGKTNPEIELGTPLDVQTVMTLHLPPGTSVEAPVATSVARDYATFTSKYSSTQNTAMASRHIVFLKHHIPGDRALDYSAFLQAVQNDAGQRFTLVERAVSGENSRSQR